MQINVLNNNRFGCNKCCVKSTLSSSAEAETREANSAEIPGDVSDQNLNPIQGGSDPGESESKKAKEESSHPYPQSGEASAIGSDKQDANKSKLKVFTSLSFDIFVEIILLI